MSRSRCDVCSLHHHPVCPQRWWPTAPLIELVGSAAEVGRRLGWADSRQVPDQITEKTADRWALALDLHPALIWTDWFDAAMTVHDAAFVAGGWRPAWLAREAS